MPDDAHIDRSVLPIRPVPRRGATAVDIRDQRPAFAATPALRPPAGAPNVVVILLDDMGFGASSAFGGPCEMPAAERLAANGLRYSRFHTTAICSPTRASLLTGRNHHSVGMGQVVDVATPAPGYDAKMPPSAATIAKVLTGNGYATGAFGKSHEMPKSDITSVGPFDRWPTRGEGFEKFYGFMGGEINQYYPTLYEDTTPIDPPATPEEGYHLSEDIVDRAIDWINDVRTITPDRPFFCYLPFGATHAPFHVRREWVDKYRGRFDEGWERQRELTLERQKALGIIPEATELTAWTDVLPRWEELDDESRRAASALMELYAGFAEHTDAQVGRFVDALEEFGELDNTLIFYILGDNGASAEGGATGTINEHLSWNGLESSAADILRDIDKLGGPDTWPHFPAGWALAMDTPYQYYKQIASHYGGTRNGLIVHWPDGIEERGGVRHQWHHVIDVAPTILEVTGIPAPRVVDGIEQMPIEGTSMTYSLNDAGAAERHITQYFEISGSRGIYHDGWVAAAVHKKAPWNFFDPDMPDLVDETWELYDTTEDWSQARDVAAEHPEKVEELKQLFLIEATRYQVLPIDDRPLAVRRNAEERGRVESMTFHAKSRRVPPDAMPNVVNRSYTVTAEIEVPVDGAEGVLCSQGGSFSGWSLYCRDGRLSFCHNVGGKELSYVRADETLTPGTHEIRFTFSYDGGGLGRGGLGTLFIDGAQVGEGRVTRTVGFQFPIGEDFNVGIDALTPVAPEYAAAASAFTGAIAWLRIDLGDDGVELSAEQRVRVELATH